MLLDAISNTARQARENLSEYANHPDTISAPWHKRESLVGMCAIASVHLYKLLHNACIDDAKVARGKFLHTNDVLEGHVWIEIPSKSLIVDITASQFQGKIDLLIPDILITKIDSPIGLHFIKGPSDPFFIRNLFAFWNSDHHPWGRLNGVNHQDWLMRSFESKHQLAIAA